MPTYMHIQVKPFLSQAPTYKHKHIHTYAHNICFHIHTYARTYTDLAHLEMLVRVSRVSCLIESLHTYIHTYISLTPLHSSAHLRSLLQHWAATTYLSAYILIYLPRTYKHTNIHTYTHTNIHTYTLT